MRRRGRSRHALPRRRAGSAQSRRAAEQHQGAAASVPFDRGAGEGLHDARQRTGTQPAGQGAAQHGVPPVAPATVDHPHAAHARAVSRQQMGLDPALGPLRIEAVEVELVFGSAA